MKKMMLLIGALVLFLAACQNPNGGGGEPPHSETENNTAIVFNNTQGICKAIVYSDYQRRPGDILATVEAGSVSPSIPWTASPSSAFYFSYEFFINGVTDTPITYTPRIDRNQINVRVDGGKTTNIIIPALDETIDSPTQVLTNNIYMYIQNASSFPFTFYRNETRSIAPNGASSSLVNAGETALYILSIDTEYVSAGDYSVYSAGAHKNFSGALSTFEAGHIYSFTFNGGGFVFEYEKIINVQNMTSYTVTYNANTASGSVPDSQTVSGGSNITLAGQGSLILDGKVFSGWNTNADGTGTAYAAGASMTVSANVTLYAQWSDPAAQYTIGYNSNGGNGTVPASQTVNGGSSVVVASGSGLSRSGYTFSGWNTTADGTGTAYIDGSSLTVNANTTLYAQWAVIVQYTVSYNANGGGGTVPASQTVNAGSSVTVANGSGLSRSGYTFSGWNTAANGTGTACDASAFLTVNSDITLYAQWAAIPPTPTPDTLSLADSLTWVATNSVNGGVYIITLRNDESISPKTISFGGKNATVILTGDTSMRTISLNANGSLFTVQSGVTLTLDNNVTLQGTSSNTAALVSVSGGTLIMKDGSKITGNRNILYSYTLDFSSSPYITYYHCCGGVYVDSGTFKMAGGEMELPRLSRQ
ncbi:hypothetical protein FACS1894141_4680 [Spirochaetia bacterium]|nr:hypothetical protein FACS1894141_4680 [Spirochaetia bacterium]